MNKAQLLSVYKMSGNEKFVWNAFCDKVRMSVRMPQPTDPRYSRILERLLQTQTYCHYVGCSEKYGYFKVDQGDRGELFISIETKSERKALWLFSKNILWNILLEYELRNRSELESQWKYDCSYDFRKCVFEKEIRALSFLGMNDLLDEHIKNRLQKMNIHFNGEPWSFDRAKMEFTYSE